MKGTKEQKGITLIALIITIVVLLILAGVAISSIQNDGILHYATNAADSWNKAQADEQSTLNGYVDWLKYATCSHTYVNSVCSNCGYAPCANGHTYGEPVITKASDCKTYTDGEQQKICTVCKNTITETVVYVHKPDETDTCTVCGLWEGEGEDYGEISTVYVARENMTHDIYEWDTHWGKPGAIEENFCTNIGCGSCIDMNGGSDGSCPECGNVCDHSYGTMTDNFYTSTMHTTQCDTCYKVLTEEKHQFEGAGDGYHECTVCGYSEECTLTLEGQEWYVYSEDEDWHAIDADCELCEGGFSNYLNCNSDYRDEDCTICNPTN